MYESLWAGLKLDLKLFN